MAKTLLEMCITRVITYIIQFHGIYVHITQQQQSAVTVLTYANVSDYENEKDGIFCCALS